MRVLAFPLWCAISQRQWLGACLLLLLLADVLPAACRLEADRTHTISPGPEMQPGAVACPSQVCAMHADGRLPLPPPSSMRHTILGWHAPAPRPMVGPSMPLDPFDTHVIAECPQDLADVHTERTKDGFVPLLRDDDDVGSAIPPDMALVGPCAPCGFSFWGPWRVHTGRNHIALHASTPERQSLCESHRQRQWLTHWSHSHGAILHQHPCHGRLSCPRPS
jgi:hypothetical protein